MSSSTTVERPVKKILVKKVDPEKDLATELPEMSANPIEELRNQAQLADNAYLEAQKQVAKAYKQREREELNTYKEGEHQAQQNYDMAVQKALEVRAEKERKALDGYIEAKDQAAKEYEYSVTEALRTCRSAIDRQWETSREVSDQIWDIYQGKSAK